jgi:hypothetical protein
LPDVRLETAWTSISARFTRAASRSGAAFPAPAAERYGPSKRRIEKFWRMDRVVVVPLDAIGGHKAMIRHKKINIQIVFVFRISNLYKI